MKNIKLTVLTTILIGIIWLYHPLVAAAMETTQTMQVEVTVTATSEWLPVGDEAGHVIGMGKGVGEAVFTNGATAKYDNVFNFDTRRGKGGTSQGYTRFTFEDGSSFFFYWTSVISVDKDGLSSSQGQGTIIKGTGRFEGIEGTSAFSSKAKILPDATRVTIAKATITYRLN